MNPTSSVSVHRERHLGEDPADGTARRVFVGEPKDRTGLGFAEVQTGRRVLRGLTRQAAREGRTPRQAAKTMPPATSEAVAFHTATASVAPSRKSRRSTPSTVSGRFSAA